MASGAQAALAKFLDVFCQLVFLPARVVSMFGYFITHGYTYASIKYQDAISLEAFMREVSSFFDDDVSVEVPYGIGKYKGIRSALEYLAISFVSVNGNFWDISAIKPDSIGSFTARGNEYELRQTIPTLFMNGALELPLDAPLRMTFGKCRGRISRFQVFQSNKFDTIAQSFAQTVNYTKYQGPYDMCMYHERYCTGSLKQYDNFTDCVAQISAMPLVSKRCGSTHITGGNSQTCRFKHKFMTPFSAHHCVHMGPEYKSDGSPNLDPNGKWKCTEGECDDASAGAYLEVVDASPSFIQASLDYDKWVESTFNVTDVNSYKFPNTR